MFYWLSVIKKKCERRKEGEGKRSIIGMPCVLVRDTVLVLQAKICTFNPLRIKWMLGILKMFDKTLLNTCIARRAEFEPNRNMNHQYIHLCIINYLAYRKCILLTYNNVHMKMFKSKTIIEGSKQPLTIVLSVCPSVSPKVVRRSDQYVG